MRLKLQRIRLNKKIKACSIRGESNQKCILCFILKIKGLLVYQDISYSYIYNNSKAQSCATLYFSFSKPWSWGSLVALVGLPEGINPSVVMDIPGHKRKDYWLGVARTSERWTTLSRMALCPWSGKKSF